MSAAASINELESPQHKPIELEEEVQERLVLEQFIPPAGPLIAVDLDDVLSQTNVAVAEWHNEKYGTNMKLSDFLYYYYWKNPYWGTPEETFKKVREFYETDIIYNTKPVPGAREGIENLRQLGFRLIIVTARAEDTADQSWKWVERYFPGCFESIVCTGQFKDAHKKGHEVVTRLSKAQVCHDLKALLLIDDSSENALSVASAENPTPVLLFGDYQWNQRVCNPADSHEDTTFDIRLKREGGKEFWKGESVPIPEGAPLWRVKDWSDALRWVKQRIVDGKLQV
ncbi:hypothetical protein CC1G_01703 [Coprinopsis cinerea okayama7|uniref:Uncharacterized protein n=1 Tax=Coprinopsis cinerea (strain Okayama-7 / 130 / ATCC MYA-4618 / FGSC 9003) TaxID=240176 RepID=A8N2A4_COPC7|nr:hypothetical protein CC1G_01703 [Coprinopsis cinerea okayama7\|eukprot:XP_001829023.2 hypothetical protein CC1G_01703 [Coprinopsis cinerea okayama7\